MIEREGLSFTISFRRHDLIGRNTDQSGSLNTGATIAQEETKGDKALPLGS